LRPAYIVTPEGYNEVITGNGGQGLTPLFPPVPGSDFRDNSAYGAVRQTITQETLTVDYVNLPGTVVYSFTMKKDPFTKKAYIVSHTDWTGPIQACRLPVSKGQSPGRYAEDL
jgi:hypothetical protein